MYIGDRQQLAQALLNMLQNLHGLTNVTEHFGNLRMLPLSTAITVTTEGWPSLSHTLPLWNSIPTHLPQLALTCGSMVCHLRSLISPSHPEVKLRQVETIDTMVRRVNSIYTLQNAPSFRRYSPKWPSDISSPPGILPALLLPLYSTHLAQKRGRSYQIVITSPAHITFIVGLVLRTVWERDLQGCKVQSDQDGV